VVVVEEDEEVEGVVEVVEGVVEAEREVEEDEVEAEEEPPTAKLDCLSDLSFSADC